MDGPVGFWAAQLPDTPLAAAPPVEPALPVWPDPTFAAVPPSPALSPVEPARSRPAPPAPSAGPEPAPPPSRSRPERAPGRRSAPTPRPASPASQQINPVAMVVAVVAGTILLAACCVGNLLQGGF